MFNDWRTQRPGLGSGPCRRRGRRRPQSSNRRCEKCCENWSGRWTDNISLLIHRQASLKQALPTYLLIRIYVYYTSRYSFNWNWLLCVSKFSSWEFIYLPVNRAVDCGNIFDRRYLKSVSSMEGICRNERNSISMHRCKTLERWHVGRDRGRGSSPKLVSDQTDIS